MITAHPFVEIGKVFVTECRKHDCDFTPDEARQLAKELREAADAVDQWNKDVDEYFKANPPIPCPCGHPEKDHFQCGCNTGCPGGCPVCSR